MTTGRINQVNGAVVETVHYRAFALRETETTEAERSAAELERMRESRLSVPTVA